MKNDRHSGEIPANLTDTETSSHHVPLVEAHEPVVATENHEEEVSVDGKAAQKDEDLTSAQPVQESTATPTGDGIAATDDQAINSSSTPTGSPAPAINEPFADNIENPLPEDIITILEKMLKESINPENHQFLGDYQRLRYLLTRFSAFSYSLREAFDTAMAMAMAMATKTGKPSLFKFIMGVLLTALSSYQLTNKECRNGIDLIYNAAKRGQSPGDRSEELRELLDKQLDKQLINDNEQQWPAESRQAMISHLYNLVKEEELPKEWPANMRNFLDEELSNEWPTLSKRKELIAFVITLSIVPYSVYQEFVEAFFFSISMPEDLAPLLNIELTDGMTHNEMINLIIACISALISLGSASAVVLTENLAFWKTLRLLLSDQRDQYLKCSSTTSKVISVGLGIPLGGVAALEVGVTGFISMKKLFGIKNGDPILYPLGGMGMITSTLYFLFAGIYAIKELDQLIAYLSEKKFEPTKFLAFLVSTGFSAYLAELMRPRELNFFDDLGQEFGINTIEHAALFDALTWLIVANQTWMTAATLYYPFYQTLENSVQLAQKANQAIQRIYQACVSERHAPAQDEAKVPLLQDYSDDDVDADILDETATINTLPSIAHHPSALFKGQSQNKMDKEEKLCPTFSRSPCGIL